MVCTSVYNGQWDKMQEALSKYSSGSQYNDFGFSLFISASTLCYKTHLTVTDFNDWIIFAINDAGTLNPALGSERTANWAWLQFFSPPKVDTPDL